MSASPYKRIAVASAFSPRFEQVLAEAKRVRDRFGSELNLIYVGKKDENTTRRFADALTALELPADSRIFYHQGSPADAILEAVRENCVELIVAGALEKEVVLRPFLGNVARRLVREAPCSVMLFTKPEREPKTLKRIAVASAFSPRFEQVLAEAKRVRDRFGSELNLIYV
ncbi:MAG: universal stress protein, partial [Chthoniobacterales bacterium]